MSSPSVKVEEEISKRKIQKVTKTVVPLLKKSHLNNLESLREVGNFELLKLLDSIKSNAKFLILDPTILGSLVLVAPLSSLKSKGVLEPILKLDQISSLKQMEPIFNATEMDTVVYMCRPRIENMKKISHQMQHWTKLMQQTKRKLQFCLILVPRRTLICEIVLEKSGVWQYFKKPFMEYSGLELIPFDNNLLSMEIPYGFKEYFIENDESTLFYCARAMMKLQALYGLFPKIKYLGPAAKIVASMMIDMQNRVSSQTNFSNVLHAPPEIEQIILFDRSVDVISPMITSLTYESLIDEFYTISNNLISLDFLRKESEATEEQQSKKPQKVPLNDNDEIYAEIRHLNLIAVGQELQRQIYLLEERKKERNTLKTIEQIRAFCDKIPQIQQTQEDLTMHIAIAQELKNQTTKADFRKLIETEQNILLGLEDRKVLEFIEQLVIKQEPLPKVLRLLCLYSVIKNGLSPKEYDFFKKEIVTSYGHFTLLTFHTLETCGLLRRFDNSKANQTISFSHLRKTCKLFEENVTGKDLNTIAYAYSGYAPLSVRLIENSNVEQAKTILKQQVEVGEVIQDKTEVPKRIVLVFFIGGVTYGEIAALKASGKLSNIQYVIATTKLMNGSTFLSALVE